MRHGTAILCIAAMLIGGTVVRAAERSPEETLRGKALIKVNNVYVVDADAKLGDALRAMKAGKTKVEATGRQRAAIFKEMQVLDDSLEQLGEQAEKISPTPKGKKGKKAPPPSDNPQLQQIYAKYMQIDGKRKEKQQQIQKLGDARGDYVTLLNETAEKWEAALRRYKTLSADALTTAALAAINQKAAQPVKLGPSLELTRELAHLREEQQAMSGVVVKFPPGSHVAELDVALNGVWITPMICDSGASYVSLSWECAKSAGLSPTPNEPTITLTLADGKRVEAKKMVLKSVQVGRYLVQNVDCVVCPPGLKDAPELLGTSFLRYFDYRMDLGAGELYLAPFGAKEVIVAGPPIDAKRAKAQPVSR